MPDLAMEWEARDGYKASRHQFIYAIIFCWQDFFFPVRMNHIVKHTTKHPEKGKKKMPGQHIGTEYNPTQ